jgi:hypothetical protein
MNDTWLWLAMAASIVVAMGAEFLASRLFKRMADRSEFDGGFRHDNEPIHITRVRAPFIVGDHE